MPVRFTFLTDKGVILLRGLSADSLTFYSPANKKGLTVIQNQPTKKNSFSEEKWNLSEKTSLSIPSRLWATISCFPFEFFKQMISEYYMSYEERKSVGAESARIPFSWKLSF